MTISTQAPKENENKAKAPLRQVYIETLGCQMNVSDSELMMGLLAKEGFSPVQDPKKADLLIINTCQIRAHSEDKAYSYLGRWKTLKKQRPELKIAMAGCVSQQTKDGIFKRAPYVDIVFGTQNIHDLPDLVRRAFEGESKILKVDRQKQQSTYDFTVDITPRRDSDISAWVTIIEGCDYFCTYCVVPYTRGRQISRSPQSILQEVNELASMGFKEITLLGQTVDSYGRDFKDENNGYGLAQLFTELNEVSGLERIRFMTSHPLDLSDEIIEAIATLPKVMEYIHIPMQAGDTKILSRMKRGYTAEEYYALTDKIHARIPDVAISGDYIVGFPGESEEQFKNTVNSVSRANIDNANTAAYSPRGQTPAGVWEDRGEGSISAEVKAQRLAILNDKITENGMKINQAFQDKEVEVLVEGRSRRRKGRLTGRSRGNKVVNFDTPFSQSDVLEDALVGKLITVKITEPFPFSLTGKHCMSQADTALLESVESSSLKTVT